MPATEEEVRQMLTVLDQYKYQVDALNQQLSMLNATEQDLGAAWEFLGALEEMGDGDQVLVPTGGGTFINATLADAGKVITPMGTDIHVEIPPKDARERIGERRDQVRELMNQVRANIERTEASANALAQQAEAAFAELQGQAAEGGT